MHFPRFNDPTGRSNSATSPVCRRDALLRQQAVIEKERNMTVGKVQARSGKVPSASELEKLST